MAVCSKAPPSLPGEGGHHVPTVGVRAVCGKLPSPCGRGAGGKGGLQQATTKQSYQLDRSSRRLFPEGEGTRFGRFRTASANVPPAHSSGGLIAGSCRKSDFCGVQRSFSTTNSGSHCHRRTCTPPPHTRKPVEQQGAPLLGMRRICKTIPRLSYFCFPCFCRRTIQSPENGGKENESRRSADQS